MPKSVVYLFCICSISLQWLHDVIAKKSFFFIKTQCFIYQTLLNSKLIKNRNRSYIWFSTTQELESSKASAISNVFTQTTSNITGAAASPDATSNKLETVEIPTLTFNSSRTVKNQTMVLLRLSTALKFWIDRYIKQKCFKN